MDIYEAIYTTRAMRRMRPDPIPLDVQARILDAAIRAPSEPDGRRFLLVDDAELRRQIAALYLSVWEEFVDPTTIPPEFARVFRSGDHLARQFAEVPLLLFGFGREGGASSVYPALQNAMLGRSRGWCRQYADDVPRFPPGSGARDPRGARRRRVANICLRHSGLSDRTVGCRRAPSRPRGDIP